VESSVALFVGRFHITAMGKEEICVEEEFG
jgi:hypothetical protein